MPQETVTVVVAVLAFFAFFAGALTFSDLTWQA